MESQTGRSKGKSKCLQQLKQEEEMAKKDFLARQRAMQRTFFEAGLQCGRQQIIDMMSLVLRDQDIVGKDTFGKERLLKVVKGIGVYIDKYQKAWEMDDETDYYRAKLDAALAEAYGEGLHDSFLKRYDVAPEYDYMKGKWK
jgi:hypothetical protein